MSDQMAIDLLSSYLRMDLRTLPRDQSRRRPDEESFDGIRTALKLIRQMIRGSTCRLGKLLLQSSDSWLLLGSAEEIAAALTETGRRAPPMGSTLMFRCCRGDFDRFVDQVVLIQRVTASCAIATRPGTCVKKLGRPRWKTASTAL